MFHDYSAKSIFLYYVEEDEHLLKWAKSFWLLKSPHPVKVLKVPKLTPCDGSALKWLQDTLKQTDLLEGLYVPLKIRPLIEIDLLLDTNQSNRYGLSRQKLPVVCLINNQLHSCEQVALEDVFEDLTCNSYDDWIQNQINFMKEKLLMGI